MRQPIVRLAVLVAAAVLIAACAQYSLVKPQTVSIGGAYTVEPQISWNKATKGKAEIWTVDGPLLQELRFIKGLEDGDKLFRLEGKKKMPTFDSDMTPLEIKELFEGSLARAEVGQVQTMNLRPVKFGTAGGFRFEFTYVTKDGLEIEGFVVGTVKDKKLYLIMYTGTRLYYYRKHKDDAERLVKSIRMP